MKQLSAISMAPGGAACRPPLWLLVLLLLLARPVAHAQAPAWQTAVAVTSSSISNATASATDAGGNVYIVGQFYGTITFGSTVLTSAGAGDVYVAKWSPASNDFVWGQRAGGAGIDRANAIAIQGNNIYVTGTWASATADFGPTMTTNTNPSGFSNDAFVTKLVDAGTAATFAWTYSYGGVSTDIAYAIAVNGSAVYVAGVFDSPVVAFGNTVLTNAGGFDAYVGRLTDAGTTARFDWTQQLGGTGSEIATGLAVSGLSVYVAGSFTGASMALGTAILANASPGTADVFIAKLTDAGTAAGTGWAYRAGGNDIDQVNKLLVNGTDLYVVGSFASPMATFGTTVLANASSSLTTDGFVAKMTDTGTISRFIWAQQAGGPGNDNIRGVAVSGVNVYVAADFEGVASFGNTSLTSAGFKDACLAKLTDANSSAAFVWAQQAGGNGSDYGYGVNLVGTRVYLSGYVSPPATFGTMVVGGPFAGAKAFVANVVDPTITATTSALPTNSPALYPNPAHATVMVQLPPVPGTTQATLTITDALARTIRTATVALPPAGLRHALDLTGLPAGVYAVQVLAGGYTATRRLVVE